MVEVRQQLLGCAYEFGAGQLVLQLIQPKRRAVHRVLGVEERASVDRLDIAYPVDVEAVRGSVALAGQLALESVQPGDDALHALVDARARYGHFDIGEPRVLGDGDVHGCA